MKIAIDFDSFTNTQVFDFASDLLDEGVQVFILTNRIGHIKSDHNQDIERLCRRLSVSFNHAVFIEGIRIYFMNNSFNCFLSGNLIDLQLVDGMVKTVPIFGNKNWKRDCLSLLGNTEV